MLRMISGLLSSPGFLLSTTSCLIHRRTFCSPFRLRRRTSQIIERYVRLRANSGSAMLYYKRYLYTRICTHYLFYSLWQEDARKTCYSTERCASCRMQSTLRLSSRHTRDLYMINSISGALIINCTALFDCGLVLCYTMEQSVVSGALLDP